jgi:transposase
MRNTRLSPSFTKALESVLDKELVTKYQTLILKHTQTSGRFNGESYIEFLKQLLQHFVGKIILVEDGASYHNSKIVQEFIAKQAARLSVHRLPIVSNDYNPIEKLWKNTKREERV